MTSASGTGLALRSARQVRKLSSRRREAAAAWIASVVGAGCVGVGVAAAQTELHGGRELSRTQLIATADGIAAPGMSILRGLLRP